MSRHREAPLVDPATDPRRSVGLACAARYLGMHKETLRGRIEQGLLPAYRDGKVDSDSRRGARPLQGEAAGRDAMIRAVGKLIHVACDGAGDRCHSRPGYRSAEGGATAGAGHGSGA